MRASGLDILGATVWVGATAAPSLADVRAKKATLKRGMKGPAVVYVQGLVGVVADADFGTETEKAVKVFQKKHDLPVDGVVGWRTLGFLDSLAGGATAGASQVDVVPGAATAAASGLPTGWVEPDWSAATYAPPPSAPSPSSAASSTVNAAVASALAAAGIKPPTAPPVQEIENPKSLKKEFPLWQAGLIGLGALGAGLGIYHFARSG